MRLWILPLVALGAAPAFADPSSPAGAPADRVVCAVLAGPDYVPGVAADGGAVVPADLPQESSQPPVAGATVEVRQPGSAHRGKIVVGDVTVRDGKAYLNGVPLASDAAIASACAGKR